MSENIDRKLNYTVDPSIQKAIQQLEKLKQEEQKLAKEILDVGKASDEQAKALKDVQKAQRDLNSVLRSTGVEFGKQEGEVEAATRALDEYEDRLRSVQKGGADLSGDLASSLGGLRGAGDAFSGGNLGAAGKGLEIGEAFADLGEFIPRLKAQAEVLGKAIQESSSAASKFASGAGNAIAGLTGMSSGAATLAVAALPVVIALGAVTVALNQFNKAQEAQRVQLEASIDAFVDTNRRIAEGLTSEETEAELARLIALREADTQSLAFMNEQYASIGQLFREQFGIVGGLLEGITRLVSSEEQQLVDDIKEAEAAVTGYDAQIEQLTQALDDGSLVANDMAEAEAQLADQRDQDMARLQAQSEQALSRSAQLSDQLASIEADRALAASNAAELQAKQSEIDAENAAIRAQDHQDKLADIAKQGQARIAEIWQEINSLPAKLNSDLAEVQEKGNEKLADIQAEYQKSTVEKYQDFTDRLEESTESAAISIKRLARDITRSLADASRENDVIAFLKAQRDGQTRLQDAQEDATRQQKQAIDEFVKGRERERVAFEDKQREVMKGIADEKAAVRQAYVERRQALIEQIRAEQQATEQRIAQERANFQEQLQREAIRARQQAELDAIRQRQEQAAHQRRIAEIQAEQKAEQMKHQAIMQAIAQISSAAAGIQTSKGNRQSPLLGSSSNNPFTLGNKTNVFQSNNVTVGDIASKRDVEDALASTALGLGNAIASAVSSAKTGASRRLSQ